jgi:CRP-like cAMP-binding protein
MSGDEHSIESMVGSMPFLELLPEGFRERVVRSSRIVSVERQSWLWHAGDTADSLGVILDGCLAVERTVARPVIFDLVGHRETVGETGVALGTVYQFDVRAIVPTRVLLVSAQLLGDGLAAGIDGTVGWTAAFAQRIVRLSQRVQVVSAGAVAHRLAGVLLDVAQRFGIDDGPGRLIPLPLRREDLAALAATTEESISRQVAAWVRTGLLRRRPDGLEVRDLASLARVAERS